jgi:hypothetical protein
MSERLNERTIERKRKPLEAVKRCIKKIPAKLNKTLQAVGFRND